VARKKRCTFLIEVDLFDEMRAIADRTGLPMAEQIRESIRWWLASRQWPPKRPRAVDGGRSAPRGARGLRKRR
jgi:hypothetical protein